MTSSQALPDKPVEPVASPAPLQSAPQAVRRSMPMALSITLGILAAAFCGWLVYYLTLFVFLLYLCFVLATILEAPVHWMKQRGIRRTFGAVLVMFGGIAVVGGALYLLINQIYLQFTALSANLEKLPERVHGFLDYLANRFPAFAERLRHVDLGAKFSAALPELKSIWEYSMSGFAMVTYGVVAFFIVMYMLIEGPDILKGARRLLPKRGRLEATRVFEEMAKAHRGWFLASAANVASASVLTSLGLWLAGVPGGLILGILAGLGELVPNVGPFFGALPSIVIVLVAMPGKLWLVLGMFVVVQTIQSYTISPMVMRFSVELPVLTLIVAVLVMGTLFGALGVAVAIPFTADLVVLWNYLATRLEKDTPDSDTVNSSPAEVRQAPKVGPKGELRNPGEEEGRAGRPENRPQGVPGL